jgi:REP element-mobilizing transposase RayT
MNPIPLAYHIIYAAYGFWLPNDPRGSWSTYVGNRRLFERFGPATKVTTRQSRARRPHDHQRRLAAKRELTHPPTVFTGRQALEVGKAIADAAHENEVRVFACAVMPDHMHLVIRAGRIPPSRFVARCRSGASRRLHDAGLWPIERPIWGRGRWDIELETDADIRTRIRYVEQNPLQAGFPAQHWSFVTPFAP